MLSISSIRGLPLPRPSEFSCRVEFFSPLRHLLDDGLLGLGDVCVDRVVGAQVVAVARARHDDARCLWRGLERASRSENAGHRRGPPRIELSIDPHKPLRLTLLPTSSVVVKHLGCLSPVRAVRVGALLREEQSALTLPIFGVGEARENCLTSQRCSAVGVVSYVCLRSEQRLRRMN